MKIILILKNLITKIKMMVGNLKLKKSWATELKKLIDLKIIYSLKLNGKAMRRQPGKISWDSQKTLRK